MKDNNIYKIEITYKAAFQEIAVSVNKNGRYVPFKDLPINERDTIVALTAQSYTALNDKNNNLKLQKS